MSFDKPTTVRENAPFDAEVHIMPISAYFSMSLDVTVRV